MMEVVPILTIRPLTTGAPFTSRNEDKDTEEEDEDTGEKERVVKIEKTVERQNPEPLEPAPSPDPVEDLGIDTDFQPKDPWVSPHSPTEKLGKSVPQFRSKETSAEPGYGEAVKSTATWQ